MSEKHALIVGNSEYLNKEYFEIIPFCVNDASKTYDKLCLRDTSIFSEKTSRLLLNTTLSDFNSEMGVFFGNTRPGDLVLIYFAGHGLPLNGSSYHIAMIDTLFNIDSIVLSSFNIDMLIPLFREKKINNYIVILDSCRSAKALQSPGVRTRNGDKIETHEINRELTGEGKILIASSQGYQDAKEEEDLEHGVFSYYFLEALDKCGKDINKELLSINDIYPYICKKVGEHSSYTQKPEMSGSGQHGEMYISKNPYYKIQNELGQEISNEEVRSEEFRQIMKMHGSERKEKLKYLKPFNENEIDVLLKEAFVEIKYWSEQKQLYGFKLDSLEDIFSLLLDERLHTHQVNSLIDIVEELSSLDYNNVEISYKSNCPAFNEIAFVLKKQKLTWEQRSKANDNFSKLQKYSSGYKAHICFDRESSGVDDVLISFSWASNWNDNFYYTPNRITISVYDRDGLKRVYLSGKNKNDVVNLTVKKGSNIRITIRPPWKNVKNDYYDVDKSFFIEDRGMNFYLSRGLLGNFKLENFKY